MADNLTLEQRHKCMSAIKGKDTKPEIIVRKYLFAKGLRFRLHSKTLMGKPDIVLPKYRSVIFIDGCFWHGHEGCKLFRLPKTNEFYWGNKIKRNKARQISSEYVLKTEGWRIFRIWECEIKNKEKRSIILRNLFESITKPQGYAMKESPMQIAAEEETEYKSDKRDK